MRESIARCGLVLTGLLGLVGCGAVDDGGFIAPLVGDDTKADAPATPFAVSVLTTTQLTDKDSGDKKDLTAKLIGLGSFMKHGELLSFDFSVCRISLPTPDPDYRPKIDDALIRRMKMSAPVTTDDFSSFDTSAAAAVLGAKLMDPVKDPLPTSGSSAQVIDDDHDGNPGISMKVDTPIGLKSIYISLRMGLAIKDATGKADGRYVGKSGMSLELPIYGDNIPFVDAAKQATKQREANTSARTADELEMAPLTGAASCAAALAHYPL